MKGIGLVELIRVSFYLGKDGSHFGKGYYIVLEAVSDEVHVGEILFGQGDHVSEELHVSSLLL